MSKAVQFHELGGPEVLKIEDWQAPVLEKGEVLMDIAAFALNRADILFFQGLHYSLPTRSRPFPSPMRAMACTANRR